MSQPMLPLDISTLDGGRALAELQRAVKVIESDSLSRFDQGGARKAILTVSVDNPVDKDTGETMDPVVSWEVQTKVPGTKSQTIQGVVKNQQIFLPLFHGLHADESVTIERAGE